MEAFKPQTAEEWDALMQTTKQPYVQALIIEARAKELLTPPFPSLNEVWGTPLEDEGIIWGNYLENTESLEDGVCVGGIGDWGRSV